MPHILLTGAAGFVGSHLSEALLARGDSVTALDNFNDYYPPAIKRTNIAACIANPRFTLHEVDICNAEATAHLIKLGMPTQPGDVSITYANINKARKQLGYDPQVSLESGLEEFVAWRRQNSAALSQGSA